MSEFLHATPVWYWAVWAALMAGAGGMFAAGARHHAKAARESSQIAAILRKAAAGDLRAAIKEAGEP